MHRRASLPARINVLGEHTDYAGGLALPFATHLRLTLNAFSQVEGCLMLSSCLVRKRFNEAFRGMPRSAKN